MKKIQRMLIEVDALNGMNAVYILVVFSTNLHQMKRNLCFVKNILIIYYLDKVI